VAEANSTKFKFTDAAIDRYRKKRPGDCQLRDISTPGLYLIIREQKQDWYLVKKINRKLFKRVLGPRSLMPIPVARAACSQLFLDLKAGIDPLQEKREDEAAEVRNSTTLTQALEQMLNGAQLADSTVKSYSRCTQKPGAFYRYRDTPLADITEEIVIECHKDKSTQSEAQANKDCRTLRLLWNWGKKPLRLAGSNPVSALNKKEKVAGRKGWNRNKRRKTAILRHQLTAWFETIRALQTSSDITISRQAKAMEVMILTGLRKNEVLRMRWDWVNWVDLTVTIPDVSSKNRQALTRPLTDRVQQLIKSMVGINDEWVFHSITKDVPLDGIIKVQNLLKDKTGIWTPPNDMRRSFASAAPAAGLSQHSIKSLMNHISNAEEVTAGYQVIDLDTMREESQKVENFILTEAGMLDRSLDVTLTDLISRMSDMEKRRLIFQLSDELTSGREVAK
jgi:integrase